MYADDALIMAARGGAKSSVVGGKSPKGKKVGAPADEMTGVLNATEHASEFATRASMFGMFGIGGGAWALGKLVKWTKNPTVSGLHGKLEMLNKATIGDVPLFGKPLAALAALPARAAAPLADAVHALGITRKLAERAGSKAMKHAALMTPHAEKLFTTPVTPEAKAALQQVHAAFSAWQETAAKGLVSHSHAEGVTKAVQNAQGIIASQARDLNPHMKAFSKHTKKLIESHHSSQALANLGDHARNAAEHVANTGISHGLMNAGIVGGVAVSDIRTGMDAMKSLRALKEMYADLTHTKADNVSGMNLLFGKVPAPVTMARAQLIKEYGPAILLDTANTVLNLDMVVRNKVGFINLPLIIALGMGSQAARGALHGNLLPSYQSMKDLQAESQIVPAELYAALVGDASEELWKRGGANCESAKALGVAYAHEQLSAKDVLQEVTSGKMRRRLDALHAEYAAAHPESAVAHPSAPQTHMAEHKAETLAEARKAESAEHHGTKAHNLTAHVESTQASRKPEKMDRPVVGEHTGRLAKVAEPAAHSVGM